MDVARLIKLWLEENGFQRGKSRRYPAGFSSNPVNIWSEIDLDKIQIGLGSRQAVLLLDNSCVVITTFPNNVDFWTCDEDDLDPWLEIDVCDPTLFNALEKTLLNH